MIDWSLTVDAYSLLGYELRLEALHPNFYSLPVETQCRLWVAFVDELQACKLTCAWKGGGYCLLEHCPRRVLIDADAALEPLP